MRKETYSCEEPEHPKQGSLSENGWNIERLRHFYNHGVRLQLVVIKLGRLQRTAGSDQRIRNNNVLFQVFTRGRGNRDVRKGVQKHEESVDQSAVLDLVLDDMLRANLDDNDRLLPRCVSICLDTCL